MLSTPRVSVLGIHRVVFLYAILIFVGDSVHRGWVLTIIFLFVFRGAIAEHLAAGRSSSSSSIVVVVVVVVVAVVVVVVVVVV